MSEQDLLAAIVANPDDLDARLVYADFLESRGDSRGELIQLSVQLARGVTKNRKAIDARVYELLQQQITELTKLAPGAAFGFDRGFAVAMTGHMPTATNYVDELLARAPLLERIHLTVHGQTDRVQLARPDDNRLVARARALHIRGRHAGNTRGARGPIGDMRGLAAVPFVRLEALRLEVLRTKPAQLVELLRSPHLGTLDSLTLHLRMPPAERTEIQPALDELYARRPGITIDVS